MRMVLRTLALAVALAACGTDDDSAVIDDASSTAGDDGARTGAAIPGGGLTVQGAIDSGLDDALMVTGYLFVEGESAKLCDAVLESYPPQCGGASLLVEGLDLEMVEGLQREGDRAWTDAKLSVVGDVDRGVIRISKTST